MRKKGTQMTNYSSFLTSNCRPHSHVILKGKSDTVSDNEDIELLVNYSGETKLNFESADASCYLERYKVHSY